MGLKARLLDLVHHDNGGPRNRRILDAIACREGKDESFVQALIAQGFLVQHGKKKGAKYGLPERKA